MPGELESYYETDLYPRVSSYVKVLHADIGDQVRQGQILAELEAPELTASLTEAYSKVKSRVIAAHPELIALPLSPIIYSLRSLVARITAFDFKRSGFINSGFGNKFRIDSRCQYGLLLTWLQVSPSKHH